MPAPILPFLVWLTTASFYVACLVVGGNDFATLSYALVAVACVVVALVSEAERPRCTCGRYRR